MENLVYQFPHAVVQELINYLGNNFSWAQAEPALKLIRENLKEIDLNAGVTIEEIPPVEGK